MNLKDKLRHIAEKIMEPRQYGKTTLLARICKELDGTLLCATFEHAMLVKRTHHVETKGVDKNLTGIMGPFFLDHFATCRLLHRSADKIGELEEKIAFMAELMDEEIEGDWRQELDKRVAMTNLETETRHIDRSRIDFKWSDE